MDKAINFAEDISSSARTIRENRMTAAVDTIAKGHTVMEGNRAIRAGYTSTEKALMMEQAGSRVSAYGTAIGNAADSHKASIVAKQIANGEKSEWLAKNGNLQRAASLFYSGDTGKLSKMRIAGVGAGVAGTGYAVFGGDDKRY